MSDDDVLYRIDIRTAASPQELNEFVGTLEAHGYVVVTDLQTGKLEIRDGGGADA